MIKIMLQIKEMNINYTICKIDASKKDIEEVKEAWLGELNFNKTDMDIEKCEFIYVK